MPGVLRDRLPEYLGDRCKVRLDAGLRSPYRPAFGRFCAGLSDTGVFVSRCLSAGVFRMVLFPAALSFVSLFAGRSGVCFSAGFSFVCLSAGFFGAGLLFSVRFSACFSARRISAVRCRSPGRDADSRDFGDRTVEPLGRQHEEYRRFAPRPLLCDAERCRTFSTEGVVSSNAPTSTACDQPAPMRSAASVSAFSKLVQRWA